jgi:WS/DGAT/MGAT family acyltransferase
MDEPTNRMVVTGVLVLDRPVAVARVRELLTRRLLHFRRFRSRVVEPASGLGTPSWEADPEFSLRNHLHLSRLPRPADERALETFVSGLLAEPFPAGRPLWKCHLVPRFQGGSALVFRIHHCIGDGLALVHVLLSMADGLPDPPAGEEGADLPREEEDDPVTRTAAWALSLPRRVLDGAGKLLARPGGVAEAALLASGGAASLANLLALPPDPPTALKGRLTVAKRAAWSRPFDLAEFKAIGRATGSTVNDILIASLAGGLRRYLLSRGEVSSQLDVRGVVPVNLRPHAESHRLGNRFGLVFLGLPLGIEDPLERLFAVRRRMRALKDSAQAAMIYQVLWAMGVMPRPVFDLAVDIFGSKATAVVTNVVGPKERISIAGAPLRQAMFWVPCSGHLGLGVSLLSYAGSVWVGVQSDAGLVPDPERILAGFEDEVDALLALRREARG